MEAGKTGNVCSILDGTTKILAVSATVTKPYHQPHQNPRRVAIIEGSAKSRAINEDAYSDVRDSRTAGHTLIWSSTWRRSPVWRRAASMSTADHPHRLRFWISGQVRRVTAFRREMKRRATVDPASGSGN